jgi:hypothetical protein
VRNRHVGRPCIDNKAGRAEGTVSFAVPSVTA